MEPREIYRSLIRLYLLLVASTGPVGGRGVTEKLRDHGFTTNQASVQRMLRDLETKGYLVSHEVRNSRSRRMYTTTQAGRLRLRDTKKKIQALIKIFGSTGVA